MIHHDEVTTARGTRAVVADSISFITEADAARIVVCASHGGLSSGEYASQHGLALVILNDAGVGKDQAGIEALSILQAHGTAAAAVSHDTARIGDVMDQWEHGVISHANALASVTIDRGMTVQAAVDAFGSDS